MNGWWATVNPHAASMHFFAQGRGHSLCGLHPTPPMGPNDDQNELPHCPGCEQSLR